LYRISYQTTIKIITFFTFIFLLANFIDHTIDVAIESVRIDIQRLTFAGQYYKRGFNTVQGIDYSLIRQICDKTQNRVFITTLSDGQIWAEPPKQGPQFLVNR